MLADQRAGFLFEILKEARVAAANLIWFCSWKMQSVVHVQYHAVLLVRYLSFVIFIILVFIMSNPESTHIRGLLSFSFTSSWDSPFSPYCNVNIIINGRTALEAMHASRNKCY